MLTSPPSKETVQMYNETVRMYSGTIEEIVVASGLQVCFISGGD